MSFNDVASRHATGQVGFNQYCSSPRSCKPRSVLTQTAPWTSTIVREQSDRIMSSSTAKVVPGEDLTTGNKILTAGAAAAQVITTGPASVKRIN